jgi:dTMP kinase
MPGRYIVIEGPDGVGKGTQARIIADWLSGQGIHVELVAEPGGDKVGRILRSILKGEPDDPVVRSLFAGEPYHLEPLTDLLLFNAARAQLMAQIAAMKADGRWVLADRSYLSTIAYQGYGDGQDIDHVELVCDIATQAAKPDIELILYAPYEVITGRVGARGTSDRIEQRGKAYARRVHDGYRAIAEERHIPLVNADQEVEQVSSDIWRFIEPLLKEEQS